LSAVTILALLATFAIAALRCIGRHYRLEIVSSPFLGHIVMLYRLVALFWALYRQVSWWNQPYSICTFHKGYAGFSSLFPGCAILAYLEENVYIKMIYKAFPFRPQFPDGDAPHGDPLIKLSPPIMHIVPSGTRLHPALAL
jgi:hypothetical protein